MSVPSCADAPNANVCRLTGTPEFHDMTIGPGDMQTVEYRLKPGVTGHVFATAGDVSHEHLRAVVLHMGVSESGIPLSPATLVMPYYAQFRQSGSVSANLQLLGLGYSLATAPLTPSLAKHPRVIKTDVFHRAVDIARAGQRIFLIEESNDAHAHMALDLLGNEVELREWDELRRREKSGRRAGAAVARELERGVTADTIDDFVDHFAAATAWRQPYASSSCTDRRRRRHARTRSPSPAPHATQARHPERSGIGMDSRSPVRRSLPLRARRQRTGELALVGRWTEDLTATSLPPSTAPSPSS